MKYRVFVLIQRTTNSVAEIEVEAGTEKQAARLALDEVAAGKMMRDEELIIHKPQVAVTRQCKQCDKWALVSGYYCSDACRQKAYRQRKALEPTT